jgi:integrase
MPLTDTAIRALKPGTKPAKHSDGGGLHLLVVAKGSKLWRLAYRYDGKQKTLAFGKYPDVSLAEARRRRDEAKELLALGIDPSQHAKLEKIKKSESNASTFEAIANELMVKIEREGRARVTLDKKRWLLELAFKDLRYRPIGEITAAEILICLRKVEQKGNYETARRLRSTIGQVFRYAIATARAENDPTFGLRGALITPTVTHRPAITDWQAFGELLHSVWNYTGRPETRAALQLMALLYPRPGELRLAEWGEFDVEKAIWIIPAQRTKMRREHRKPLSGQVLYILQELHKITGHRRLMFPSTQTRDRPLSENTMNMALRRMGYEADIMTSHGFRASASSLLNESGKWSPDAIEAELAHVGTDKIRQAYHRAIYWDERIGMSQWWADELMMARQRS